jgi:RNA polymerase sigma-70 factor (ECF subfamily)
MPPDPGLEGPRLAPAGEPDLDEAFAAYRVELTSLARRALGSPHLAEEAVQETFIRAWRSRQRFDPAVASVRTWLYAIERNLLVDMARSRQRQELRDQRLGPGSESIVDHVERAMDSWQVEEAVNHLSEEHRTVIVEIYLRGRTSREMAHRLAIPEGTVRSRLFYALKALRLTLEEMGWTE